MKGIIENNNYREINDEMYKKNCIEGELFQKESATL